MVGSAELVLREDIAQRSVAVRLAIRGVFQEIFGRPVNSGVERG